ncbi:hypothetical protein GCM10017717_03140 [Deinococcus persicinus]
MTITKSAVSQQIAKLEKDGYIIKRQHVDDKRGYSIELGEKGLLYKQEGEAFNQEITKKYQAQLSDEELVNVIEVLEKLKSVLL